MKPDLTLELLNQILITFFLEIIWIAMNSYAIWGVICIYINVKVF